MAPRLRLTSITIGAPNPRRLAAFYATLLGVTVGETEPPRHGEPEDAGWAQVRAGALTVNFEFEHQWQTPHWPAQPGQPIATQHLDIEVDDLAAAAEWAVSCGARMADHQPQPDVRVMIDPCGHPFCLFE